MSYAVRHGLTLWGNPLALGIAEELRIICQAVTIRAVVECDVSKEPMASLGRGVIHVGGFVTGDGQTLLVTSTPFPTGQALNGIRPSKGIPTRLMEKEQQLITLNI